MQKIVFFILVLFLAAFFYIKEAVKSFKISVENLSSLKITKNSLQGVVLLHLTNNIIPTFSVENVKLDVYLNEIFVSPATSVENRNNGYIKLFLDVDFEEIVTLDNILIALKKETIITIKGSVKGTLGASKILNYTVGVDEVIQL